MSDTKVDVRNPFGLKAGDMVVGVNEMLPCSFGKILKIKTLNVFGDMFLPYGFDVSYELICNFEPFVRAKKPEPVFTPKFKKGDRIISNSHCGYNKGKYTVSGYSWINSLDCKEYCSVNEIHSILDVNWYDKYIPIKKFAVGDNVRYSHKTCGIDIIFDVKVLGYDDVCNDKFYGEVTQQGSGPYQVGLKAFFMDEHFTVIPFVPRLRKNEEFIYSGNLYKAYEDSYMFNGIEVVKFNHYGSSYPVIDCKKFKYLD